MSHSEVGGSRRDILIVDDTPANLRLLSQMLAERGYRVRPVPDGPLALAAVRAEPPDLILLDIRMPEMDGYEVCGRLKAEAQTREIPILFISALDATQDKVRAFTVGGVDYITKPFQIEEVLARVETHLALRELQKRLQDANRKMAQELALAGEVQASFLPRELPRVPGWQLSATLKPARETSGDFYDFVSLPDNRLGILAADVSDKGAGAALYMALSCTLIRTYALQFPGQPELVLSAANRRILRDTGANQFVTVFYGILDPGRGRLVYANAGHPPPYHVGASADGLWELAGTGIPLGVLQDQGWGQEVLQIDPGDTVLFYTDGITEACNAEGELFGEERLRVSVRAVLSPAGSQTPSAQEVQEAILGDVQAFLGEVPPSDDIALVVLMRE
jgi:sigma-B regulation protein RsbU (phosphoserine phosphatase)